MPTAPTPIRNSHDLADLLEKTAFALRALPPLELAEDERTGERNGRTRSQRVRRQEVQERLNRFVDQLPGLSRTDAENELASLTVAAIRQLAPMLDVRIPSKATKSEYIRLLLIQLFDAPAGQELIRTFHKRNDRTSLMKSSAQSPPPKLVPTGKDR